MGSNQLCVYLRDILSKTLPSTSTVSFVFVQSDTMTEHFERRENELYVCPKWYNDWTLRATRKWALCVSKVMQWLNTSSDEKMSFMFVQSDTMTEHFERRENELCVCPKWYSDWTLRATSKNNVKITAFLIVLVFPQCLTMYINHWHRLKAVAFCNVEGTVNVNEK